MNERTASAEPRILLMEQDAPAHALVRDTLCAAGFVVVEASGLPEAMEDATYSLAILGYGAQGTAAAVEITRLRVPFMFLSAHADSCSIQKAVAAGALAYLMKPVEPARLLAAVHVVLGRAREFYALLEQTERLSGSLEHSTNIGIAVGLLMARRGLARDSAYESLRQHARRTRKRLTSLAKEVTTNAQILNQIRVANLGRAKTNRVRRVEALNHGERG